MSAIKIIAWLARKQQQRELQQVPQQRELQQVRERELQELRQQERPREQQLLLSYHKQPERRQRSELPKREICSFLGTKVS